MSDKNYKIATLIGSSLEKIDGIGPAKAKKLLHAFNTLSAIKTASEEELSAINGISQTDAKNIYNYFNNKDLKG